MSGFYVYILIVSIALFILTGIAIKLYRIRKCPTCKKRMTKIRGEYFFPAYDYCSNCNLKQEIKIESGEFMQGNS